jgi:hypothetical protein
MKRLIPILVAALALAACTNPNTEFTAWQKEDVAGYSLTRVHESAVEYYQFHEAGHAAATFGSKDGAVTGPIVYWKIEDGRLVIFDEKHTYQRLTLIQKKNDEIVTRASDGTVATWKLAQ